VRRTQDHLAEPPVGRLADLAASLQRFQLVEDEIHGLVAPRKDRVVDESLDPLYDRGFEMHRDFSLKSNDGSSVMVLDSLGNWHANPTGRVRSPRGRAFADCGRIPSRPPHSAVSAEAGTRAADPVPQAPSWSFGAAVESAQICREGSDDPGDDRVATLSSSLTERIHAAGGASWPTCYSSMMTRP
jgi:hypothetical protein